MYEKQEHSSYIKNMAAIEGSSVSRYNEHMSLER